MQNGLTLSQWPLGSLVALAASWEPPGSLLGAFWEPPGESWQPLGSLLGASWFPPLLRCVVDAPTQSHNVKKSSHFFEV